MKEDRKGLICRYLVWCYKATKEDVDKVDRKFTQLEVDHEVLTHLIKSASKLKGTEKAEYLKKIDEFKAYMAQKEEKGIKEKFDDPAQKIRKAEYVYLVERLRAIEKTIVSLFGKKELMRIQSLYEEEMTRRILEAREHN